MMTNRRAFIGLAVMAGIGSLMPLPLMAASALPDYDFGVRLIHVYRNGVRIRMKDLRVGDTFTMGSADSKRRYRCDSVPQIIVQDGQKTWSVIGWAV